MKYLPLFVALPLTCWLFLAGCSVKEAEVPNDLSKKRGKEAQSESYGVAFHFTESAKQKAHLKAKHVLEYFHQDRNETEYYFDQGIEINFYTPDGQLESRLTANTARMFRNKGFAEAKGNVVVVNQKGERLETETLKWFKGQNKISTNDFVTIKTTNDVLYGDSLTANTAFSKYQIYKIRGSMRLPKS